MLRTTARITGRLLKRGQAERGDATVEMVLILPVFAVFFFLLVQGGIWLDAGNVAQAAAVRALNEARTYQSTAMAGTAAAEEFLADNGSSLKNSSVSVTRNATQVSVTVTGNSLEIIGGWLGTDVTRTVTGPVERWVQ